MLESLQFEGEAMADQALSKFDLTQKAGVARLEIDIGKGLKEDDAGTAGTEAKAGGGNGGRAKRLGQLFGGADERFAFARAVSRLLEMDTARYKLAATAASRAKISYTRIGRGV